jgi:hypothetical protein
MAGSFWSEDIKKVSARKLKIPKARELAALLHKPGIPFARLIQCRRSADEESEVVELEVQVEVGQKTVHDIRKIEPIAVIFTRDDQNYPEILALREDFSAPGCRTSAATYFTVVLPSTVVFATCARQIALL